MFYDSTDLDVPPSTLYREEMVTVRPETPHTLLPGEKCLEDFANNVPLEGVYCNATWDTLYCWPATPAGRTAKASCASVFSDLHDLRSFPDAMAFRECDWSGSWLWNGWTNYSQCLNVIEQQDRSSGVLEAVRYITFIGALLSLLTLTITIFIFMHFKTLECDRLRVHRNFVVSLLMLFLVMLVLTEPFVSNRQTLTYRHLDWLCKTLLSLRMYAQMASINWMFVEGLFLHSKLTSNVFDSGAPFTLYYIIGWGLPLVFLTAWGTTMTLHHPVHCWRGYGDLPYIWILVAPMVTALMINLLFLVNILRILLTKLRSSPSRLDSGRSGSLQRRNHQRYDTHTQRHSIHRPQQQIHEQQDRHVNRHVHKGGQQQQAQHNIQNSIQSKPPQHDAGLRHRLTDDPNSSPPSAQPRTSPASPQHHNAGPTSQRLHSTNATPLQPGSTAPAPSRPHSTDPANPRQSSPSPPLLQRPQRLPQARLGSSRNPQQHPGVGYAANRPEFNVRKAIRATLVLFPLLGTTNLLFAVNPGDKGDLEGAYMLTNALLQSSQGVFVSVLYCFLNSDVQDVVRKRWRQYLRMRRQSYHLPSNHQRKRSTAVLEPSVVALPTQRRAPANHALRSSSASSMV